MTLMPYIVADLDAYHNPPGSDHYCNFPDLNKPCRPYIITYGSTRATVACPDTGQGYIYQRIKGGWYQIWP